MKRNLFNLMLVCLMAILFIAFTGCAREKEFSKAGMTITLTTDFVENDIVTQTAYYVSQKAIVTALKEDGSALGNYTVEQYAKLVCKANNLSDSSVTVKDDYAEFTYEKELNGKEYFYYARCLKNGTDYWLFQFACETKNSEKYVPTFEKWASTIKFDA